MFRVVLRRLVAVFVIMLVAQMLAPVPAQAQKPVRSQHYTLSYPNNASGSGLIRSSSRTTTKQYRKTYPAAYATAPRPGQQQQIKGAQTTKSGSANTVEKWMKTLQHSDGKIAPSAAPPSREAVEWQHAIDRLKNKSREEQIKGVNDLMNKVPYVSDTKNYGARDHWANPSEFVTRGGDCEDYAIAKYASLRKLGIPANQMHIDIVKDKSVPKDNGHAILVVHGNRGDVVLDNIDKKVENAGAVNRYTPVMSVNSDDWWLNKSKKNR